MPSHREVDASGSEGAGDPRRNFAEALRDARELRAEGRWTQKQLARAVQTSSSTISRIEGTDTPIPSGLPILFDHVFGTEAGSRNCMNWSAPRDSPRSSSGGPRSNPRPSRSRSGRRPSCPGCFRRRRTHARSFAKRTRGPVPTRSARLSVLG
ncbi:multiprotein-bridging factor 1 family protein [Streptomyces uncialis]|uniref:helix-turn-helix domain-containing protein n=1 Tax=Streptomyces uncialis TaxID=1048205 RepID=UPI003820F90A